MQHHTWIQTFPEYLTAHPDQDGNLHMIQRAQRSDGQFFYVARKIPYTHQSLKVIGMSSVSSVRAEAKKHLDTYLLPECNCAIIPPPEDSPDDTEGVSIVCSYHQKLIDKEMASAK